MSRLQRLMFCGPFICWGGLPHDCHNLVSVLLLPKLSTSGCPDLLGSKVFGLRIPPFRILFVMLGQISLILTKLLQRLSEKPKSGIGSILGISLLKRKGCWQGYWASRKLWQSVQICFLSIWINNFEESLTRG